MAAKPPKTAASRLHESNSPATATTEDSPDLLCCICLSPECSVLYQVLAALERRYFNITQKASSSHNCHYFYLPLFNVKRLNTFKKRKKKEQLFFTRNKKETSFHFFLEFLLNTHLFTQYCSQKNICLI